MTPTRVQMSRRHPWRAEHPDAVIVARPSRWGNPFKIVPDREFMGERLYRIEARSGSGVWFFPGGDYLHREAALIAVRLYRRWITGSQTRIEDLTPLLRGRDLACWCRTDELCHGDVLLEIANRLESP